MAEYSQPELYGQESLAIVHTSLERMRESERFVVVLGSSRCVENEHGSALWMNDLSSAVRHFEVELFQAALFGKPVDLLIIHDFSRGHACWRC